MIQPGPAVWWALIVGAVGDFAVPYLLAMFYPGYSHTRMVMSLLGNSNSPVRVWYNLWLVLLGVLLSLSAWAIAARYWPVSKALGGAAGGLMLLFALGAGVLSGLFSVTEQKSMETVAARIHGVGASIGFMALLFVPLLLGILSLREGLAGEGAAFLISFALAFGAFVLFVMADKPGLPEVITGNEGTWQRLTLLFMYLPLVWVAGKSLMR